MTLSFLAILLGLGCALLHLGGVINPRSFGERLQRFPRSTPIGWALMGVATAWFLHNLQQEKIADFMAYKRLMIMGFAAVGIGCCVYVKDFLAVRGLAVLLLLLAKLGLDAARWVDTPWRLVIVVWAYVWIFFGVWWTVSPWRCRDLIGALTRADDRLKTYSAAGAAFGLFVLALGVTVYR